MKAVLRIKRYSERQLAGFVNFLTDNGYKVSIEKGDRVSERFTIYKECTEYVKEGEQDEVD